VRAQGESHKEALTSRMTPLYLTNTLINLSVYYKWQ